MSPLPSLWAALSYAENSLGQVYKEDQDGVYTGGAYYYMQKGKGWKFLPAVFAILTVISVPLLNPMPHANNVAGAFHTALGIPRIFTGCLIAILLFIVISGGIKRIAKVATVVVPFMTTVPEPYGHHPGVKLPARPDYVCGYAFQRIGFSCPLWNPFGKCSSLGC